jgi:hypothetical protein
MLKIVATGLLILLAVVPWLFYSKVKPKLFEETNIPNSPTDSNLSIVVKTQRLKTSGFIIITSYITIMGAVIFWVLDSFLQSLGKSTIGTVYWALFFITLFPSLVIWVINYFKLMFKNNPFPGIDADVQTRQEWNTKYYATLRQNLGRIFLPLIIYTIIFIVVFATIAGFGEY